MEDLINRSAESAQRTQKTAQRSVPQTKKSGGSFIGFIIALLIPGLFFSYGVETKRYCDLSSEITALEKKQERLIEQNKRLVSDISVLSSTERIEKLATGTLGMHKATSQEIVRVEMEED